MHSWHGCIGDQQRPHDFPGYPELEIQASRQGVSVMGLERTDRFRLWVGAFARRHTLSLPIAWHVDSGERTYDGSSRNCLSEQCAAS